MKKSDFEKAAIDILGKKHYDAFDGRISSIAESCAVKLFVKNEINTESANVIRDLIIDLWGNGFSIWEKE